MNDFEKKLREIFEENYEFLKLEGGHAINDYIKEEAFNQVLYYWRRNRELIERVTQAEVKLALPEQRTPKAGYRYALEGVVDIVREGGETWMYDIKTHDRASVEGNIELYRSQLNVYAYIWKNLRGNDLDDTAVISTVLPQSLKAALRSGNADAVEEEMKAWDPVIPLGYSEEEVERMIEDFGAVVEAIEENRFSAPPAERLASKEGNERNVFAVRVCRNCDVRFSCRSFREYVRNTDRGNQSLRKYLDDYGTEFTPEAFIEGNLAEE